MAGIGRSLPLGGSSTGIPDYSPGTLRDALALVDIGLLDHIIIAGDEAVSLAERGLL